MILHKQQKSFEKVHILRFLPKKITCYTCKGHRSGRECEKNRPEWRQLGSTHALSRLLPTLSHAGPRSPTQARALPRSPALPHLSCRQFCEVHRVSCCEPGFLLPVRGKYLQNWNAAMLAKKCFLYGAPGYLARNSVKVQPCSPIAACVGLDLAGKKPWTPLIC